MNFLPIEKQAFSSLLRTIMVEDNGFDPQIKFTLINLLSLMGIKETEFKSTIFLNKTQSIKILETMNREKRIYLLCEMLKYAGYVKNQSGFDMSNRNNKIAVFDLLLETGCFGEDISYEDLEKIDPFYDSMIVVIKYNRSEI
jgi:hypothetical protein